MKKDYPPRKITQRVVVFIFCSIKIMLLDVNNGMLFVVTDHGIGNSHQIVGGILHGQTQACHFHHFHIIGAVSHGNGLLLRNAKGLGKTKQSLSFSRLA